MPKRKGGQSQRARVEARKLARANESAEQTSSRRAQNAQQMATSRVNESEEQTSSRRAQDRLTHAISRVNESEEQTSSRRAQNAQSNATFRANESEEQISSRRARDVQRKTITRVNESEEQTSSRRAQDVQRHATFRVNESEEQSSTRRAQDSQRHTTANRQNASRQRETQLIAALQEFDESTILEHSCGELTEICQFCNSKNFPKERPSDKKFNVCCNKGKVVLPQIRTCDTISQLLTGEHQHSKNFMEHIRSYNSALGFASMGANIAAPPGYGPYCFRIHGQIYHRAGTLHPAEGEQQKYAQLYILDPDAANEQRMSTLENAGCNSELMLELGHFFTENNVYANAHKMMHEVEQEAIAEAELRGVEPSKITMAIRQDRNSDPRRYNAQRVSEVAMIFSNADGEPPLERDLLIHLRPDPNYPNMSRTKRISVLDCNLEPMVYPILFPYGEHSWGPELQLININGNRTRVTQMQYYGYRFAIRDEFNPFLSCGKLTQQYMVDAYVKTEANRLNYIRQHQTGLRVELYRGLIDHINSLADQQGLLPGVPVILPSSFTGSPRHMQQNYQDAMAIVRAYGKPDLFITMTCNPNWKEIKENIPAYQKVEHRPDLVARVFKLKLKELLDDICKKHVLGVPIAKIHVIEFQKRGLPHAHILIILKYEHKPHEVETIDKLVCAEIPDKNVNPRLHEIVSKNMVHGPCGSHNLNSPCMENGSCTKGFPKEFQNETIANLDGYPRYIRRNNGRTALVRGKEINNSWIVPYNPFLSLKYNCHINVEICASIKSVKYLFKYVYKGHDCANIDIKEQSTLEHNEIKTFMDSRYVSAPEAAWRLFGFDMHHQTHTVVKLAVHLPDCQPIVFLPEDAEKALENAGRKDTSLTAWFKLNTSNEEARQYLYSEIPKHFVLNNRKEWQPRQRGAEYVIGRMYAVNLSDIERYYLRLLLLHVPGATSFDDLKTFNGTISQTFKEAARLRGLLHDDATWEQALLEAETFHMPFQLRQLFAIICTEGNPTDPLKLWNDYKEAMCEDFVRKHLNHNDACLSCENFALLEIRDAIYLQGKDYNQYGLPIPTNVVQANPFDPYDIVVEQEEATKYKNSLNAEQKMAFETIMKAIESNSYLSKCYFLDGPGGSGKTYLYKTLLSVLRGDGEIALPSASAGIAANLLKGGRTYHSLYKLPVPLLNDSKSSMRMTSPDAAIIRSSKLLILDEATMATSHALAAIDRLLKDITQSSLPFGGKVILLGGDFRQSLPVVPHAKRTGVVEASIKFSNLWKEFKTLRLTSNVRSVDPEYSNWLIELGNGTLTNSDGLPEEYIEIPNNLLSTGDIVKDIFGDSLTPETINMFSKSAILCPLNNDMDKVNEQVLDILKGETKTYLSSDSIEDENEEDRLNYPIEFLHDQRPSGMPPHKLNLKVGAIIMLLRNLNTKRGLCNGTRLNVKDLKPNLIIAEVLTGSAEGQVVFIPRIDLAPKTLTFHLF